MEGIESLSSSDQLSKSQELQGLQEEVSEIMRKDCETGEWVASTVSEAPWFAFRYWGFHFVAVGVSFRWRGGPRQELKVNSVGKL